MCPLVKILFLVIFFVNNKADPTSTQYLNDGSIEEIYVLEDGPSVSALVFMKENEDTTSESNEEDDTETLPAEDVENYEIETNRNNLEELCNSGPEELYAWPKAVLRRRPWRGCLKKAGKICTKACKSASKNACASRDCAKKLKKTLKKECKRECKSYFLGD